ncbi:MAG: ribosomal protein L7/L12 [Chloroflexota bacterium]
MNDNITETLDLNFSYDVVVVQSGPSRFTMIAALQSVRDVDVETAEAFLDALPQTFVECVEWKRARHIKRTLEEAGAKVELRLCHTAENDEATSDPTPSP